MGSVTVEEGSMKNWVDIIRNSLPYEKANNVRRDLEKEKLGWFGSVYISKVIYSNNATIVFWSDGTKTVTKCSAPDNYNQEYALMMCVLKKLHSTKNISKFLKVWTNEDTVGTVTVKDVRKKEKENA